MVDPISGSGSLFQASGIQRDPEGDGAYLPPGRSVTATVDRILAGVAGGARRYQVTILGQSYLLEGAPVLQVGSLIELIVLRPAAGQTAFAYRGANGRELLRVVTPGATEPRGAEAPAARDGGARASKDRPSISPARPMTAGGGESGVLDEIGAELRRLGVPAEREVLEVIARLARESALRPQSAARVAAELRAFDLPITAPLLRGGAWWIENPGSPDPRPALARFLRALESIGGTVEDLAAELAELRRHLELRTASTLAARTPEAFARPRVAELEALIGRIIGRLLARDPLLAGVRAELARLELAGGDGGGAAGPRGAVAEPLQAEHARRLLAEIAAASTAMDDPPLSEDACRQAVRVLRDLERQTIERSPELGVIREALRDVHARLEASAYQQLLDWLSLGADEKRGAGLWHFGEPRGEMPVRYRFARRGRAAGGADFEVVFQLEVAPETLGPVEVSGDFRPQGARGGLLRLRFAAERAETHAHIADTLSELTAALEALEYQTVTGFEREASEPGVSARVGEARTAAADDPFDWRA